MPTYKNKPRPSYAWLPNQVRYGMDCSDVDPNKWKPFGTDVEAAKAQAAKPAPKPPAPAG